MRGALALFVCLFMWFWRATSKNSVLRSDPWWVLGRNASKKCFKRTVLHFCLSFVHGEEMAQMKLIKLLTLSTYIFPSLLGCIIAAMINQIKEAINGQERLNTEQEMKEGAREITQW